MHFTRSGMLNVGKKVTGKSHRKKDKYLVRKKVIGKSHITYYLFSLLEAKMVIIIFIDLVYISQLITLTGTVEKKVEKRYIMLKQHKIRLQNTKQLEPHQKYRLGTISNIKLRGSLNRFYRRLTHPHLLQWFTTFS